MQTQIFLSACVCSIFSSCLAAPPAILQPRASASCTAYALTPSTWTSLNLDSFLAAWSAKNVTVTQTDNVQSLAASFGAPNFFCGLDEFCNAGQPCLPTTLPAWYIMVAIQNWNSYMNAMNSALSFASTMVSLTLPGIVNDFYPNPVNNITPLQEIGKIFTSVLGLVPFIGALKTTTGAFTAGLNFVLGVVKPPTLPNLFVDWSSISTSLATVLEQYQNGISSAISTTLNAPVNSSTGINSLLVGGSFLGVTQNFTESDIQSALINSTNVLAISLTFQAQKIFIFYTNGSVPCDADGPSGIGNSQLAITNSQGGCTAYLLTQGDSNGNANNLDSFADLLISKYGMTQQEFLVNPTNCFFSSNQQLDNPFDGSLPLDSTTECLFNVIVCNGGDGSAASQDGIVGSCQNQGLDV